ncbi:MAG: hypothetical protein KKA67_03255 [Spirochaetes bacterium]|nr:hypothetical protein [Spirochaetota bacterium]MBU1081975.1 hypothetical protein [Spirochaetota bacterium]
MRRAGASRKPVVLLIAGFAIVAAIVAAAIALYFGLSGDFEFQRALGFEALPDGRFLITDGGGSDYTDTGSSVFIVDRAGRVRWRATAGLRFAHSATMLANGNVLVPDTNGDRLVEIDDSGDIVWSSEEWGGGSGILSNGIRLDYPNHATELPDGDFLISARYNDAVLEVDRTGRVSWAYEGARRQHAPRRLPDGNTLIADSDGDRVIEIDREGDIVWSYGQGLDWPRFAQRLANGNTLITDSNNNRILEVSREGAVVFEYGQGVLSAPYQAEELPGGTIMIADAQHGRLLEIDRAGAILWTFSRKRPLRRWLALPAALTNGGAERASTDGSPKGWKACDLLAPDDAGWSRDAEVSRSGEASLAIRADSGTGTNRWWGQFIKSPPRGTVVLAAWVKTAGVAEGAGIAVTFVDRNGGLLGGASSKPRSGDSEWAEAVVIAEIPAGAAAIGVTLSLIGTGAAWWDDARLSIRSRR